MVNYAFDKRANAPASTGGISFIGLLFLLLLGLKLAGVGQVAGWSWWLVAAPLWVPVAAVLSVVIVTVALALAVAAVARFKKFKK